MATVPNFSQPVIFSEVATPTVPDSGYLKVYAKSGTLYSIANGGSEKAYVVSTDLSSYLPLAGGTLVGDLLFTDATYDIGKSGATRPRDGFFSRDLTIGRSLIHASANAIFSNNAFSMTAYAHSNGSYPALTTYAGSGNGGAFGWTNGGYTNLGGGITWGFVAGATHTTQLRAWDTNAQTFEIFNTFTSSTSHELIRIKANAGAAYQIGSAIGSAGGTTRSIDIGYWDSAGTFKQVVTTTTTGIFIHEYPYRANEGITISQPSNNATIHSTRNLIFDSTHGNIYISDNKQYLYFGTGSQSYVGGTTHVYLQSAKNGNVYIRPLHGYDNSGGTFVDIRGCNAWASSTGTIVGGVVYLTGGNGASSSVGAASGGAVTIAGGIGYGTGVGGDINLTAGAGPTGGTVVITQPVSTTGSPTAFTLTDAAHTTMTASTEATSVNFNLSSTKQFATGAISTQRAVRIQAPTYSFVGASTITTASTLSISGSPVAGTNATITNAYALNVESGNVRVGGNIVFPASGAGSRHIGEASSPNGVGFKFDYDYIYGTYAGGTFLKFDLVGGHLLRDSIRFYTVYGGYTPVTVRHGSSPFVDMQKWEDSAGTLQSAITATGGFLTNDIVIRNATTATGLQVHGTWTSTTSYERLNIKGKASANFEIGPENGSAGGTLRGLTIGGYSAGSSTITPWMSFTGSTGELGIFGNGVVRQNKYGDDATAAIYTFRKYRGTESVPTEVQSGDLIGQILFQGYHGSTIGTSAAIQVIATEAFTSAPNRPTRMAFNTTAPGDTQSSIRMTITDVGTTWFGVYSTSYTNAGLVGIAGSNASGAENNTLLFRDNSTLNGIGQVLGKIAFWSADTTSPGAGVKAWISCVSESATVANAAIVFATDTTTGTPTEQMRITSGGNVGIGTGSTVSARTHVISTTEQLRIGYDSGDYYSTTVSSTGAVTFDAVGSAPLFAFSKLVGQSAAEITNTPTGTTQTITLNNGNHQTLTLTSATGTVAVTLTVPSKVSSGTIIVKQHATTPRNITWAVSAGTIKWMGTQPAWSSDGVTEIRIVSWRYDGSVMYLMSTDVAS